MENNKIIPGKKRNVNETKSKINSDNENECNILFFLIIGIVIVISIILKNIL